MSITTRTPPAKTIEPTMHSLDDTRSDSGIRECSNARTKPKQPAQRAATVRESTVAVAGPLAENHQRWMRALQSVFAVCEVTERKALERVMANLKPDVLVIDLALPGLRRVRGLREIQRLNPATKIIALADTPAEEEGLTALKLGAKGYCARTLEPENLMKAITAVRNGEIWASRKLVRALVAELRSLIDSRKKEGVRQAPDPRLEQLTERQRLVAVLISRGASNKEISNRLNISERTVKAHLTEAFRNVGVSDRLQLALLLQGHSSALGDD